MVCEYSVNGIVKSYHYSLNPCFNGIWSARAPTRLWMPQVRKVLILVLMEYGLRVPSPTIFKDEVLPVLILVLMEYGLRDMVLTSIIDRR